MKRLLLAAALLAATATFAEAHEYRLGDLRIDHPHAFPSLGQAKNGAAYLTVQDLGTSADTLVSAAGDVAERVELHTHVEEDGVMKMREMKDGALVPAGETIEFRPGGMHIMLIGLEKPLTEGESFPLVLTFEKAGAIEVEVKVEARHGGHGEHEKHGEHEGHDAMKHEEHQGHSE